MNKNVMLSWQTRNTCLLEDWASGAEQELEKYLDELCNQEEIDDDSFVLVLKIQMAMLDTDADNFSEGTSIQSDKLEAWLGGKLLPSGVPRKMFIGIFRATSREATPLEKMLNLLNTSQGQRCLDKVQGGGAVVSEVLSSIPVPVTKVDTSALPFDPWMDIYELQLSTRVGRIIRERNIGYLGQIVMLSEEDLFSFPQFGRKSMNELKEILSCLGARLKMTHPVLDQFAQDLASGDVSNAQARMDKLLEQS